jgi:cell division protein FtsB
VLGVVGLLYSRPIASYLETRSAVAERRQEVAILRAEKALLVARLEQTTNLAALAREARRAGLVRPGEQLFIVKGVAEWRRARAER